MPTVALLVGIASFTSCKDERPAVSTVVPVAAPVPQPAGTASKETCARGLKGTRQLQEQQPTNARFTPGLVLFNTDCSEVLGELAPAARAALRASSRGQRANILGTSANALHTDAGCRAVEFTESATSYASACPGVASLGMDGALRDLDVGTVSYLLAVRTRLNEVGAFDDDAQRVLENMALSAALEGEAQR